MKKEKRSLSEDEVLANRGRAMAMVAGWQDQLRVKKVTRMLEGPVGSSYFTAPASSRTDYHECYPGGLCEHSLHVVQNLKKISAALEPGAYSDDVLEFVGLFHDLGKVGDGDNEYYVPNPSEWHREKLGKLYETNPDCRFMPTSERGLWILHRNGISVTFDEWVAIRLNDGQYVRENEPYRLKEPRLALLVHWADRWSLEQEKGTEP